jgi:AcrR family transcriptional regulator
MIVKTHHSNDVIMVAALLFREKGYYGTSINDIAKKSGISEQAIHDIFTSKEALAIAVMTKIQEYFDKNVLIHAYDGNLLPKIVL